MALSKADRDLLNEFVVREEGNGEWRAHCPRPQHEDEVPSANFNFNRGLWSCHGCGAGGKLTTLIKRLRKWDSRRAPGGSGTGSNGRSQGSKRPDQSRAAAPTRDDVEGYKAALWGAPRPVIDFLVVQRGLDWQTLINFDVGWSEKRGRYTIPVYDKDGSLVNIRFYKPNPGKKEAKFTNVKGYGQRRLFGLKMLPKVDTVVLAEGEFDVMILVQHGWAAVSGTGGARTFDKEWAQHFSGKHVYIAYDCDDDGREGSLLAAERLRSVAESVAIVDLGLQEKEDVTDFFAKYWYNAVDFRNLLERAEPYGHVNPKRNGQPQRTSLRATYDAQYSGHPLEVVGTVVGKKQPPYQTPRTVSAHCTMDWSEKACPVCPMYAHGGQRSLDIDADDGNVLKFMDTTANQESAVLKELAGAPPRCSRLQFEREENQNIERLIVGPNIEGEESEEERDARQVLSVGQPGVNTNTTVRMIGTNLPDPRNQLNSFMTWDVQETESSLDTFELTPENIALMRRFQCAQEQSPLAKMREIAYDLSENVTNIYGRLNLQIATDLVLHSILQIPLRGSVKRGWLDFIVIGDTRTGKSELVQKTVQHYGAGTVANCETATMAGLLGAVKQHGNDWSLEWGLIPLNDRRAVVLDEASGLNRTREDIISQLSGVRSSGIAEIHKVESGATHARTRLLWISNPISGENLSDSMHGVQEIRRLIGNNEDVARFDFAMGCTIDEVSLDEIRKAQRATVEHFYTSEACHALVMWAWSRKPDQVEWSEAAEAEVFRAAAWFGEHYRNDPPLLQQTNSHEKIARLAAAVAARVFSTDETCEKVVIRKSHVRAASMFLNTLYSSPTLGYRDMSEEYFRQERHAREYEGSVRDFLAREPIVSNFLYRSAIGSGRFRSDDLQTYLGLDASKTNLVMKKLYSSFMIDKEGPTAIIKPILNSILRDLHTEGE